MTSRLTAHIATRVCLLAILCVPLVQAAASAEGSFDRTLKVSGPIMLDVSTGSGSISVRRGPGDSVRVTGHIKATNLWFSGDNNAEERVRQLEANPPILQSGNTIRIGHISDPELRRNISISYDLVVPEQTELRSHTGSGSQDVDGLRGPLEVGTGSGSIKISGSGDTVRAETGSGSIDVVGVKGNVRAKTGSGSIRATDVAGGFEGSTGSGHIELELTAPGAVRLDTGSGGLQVRGVRGSLEAQAGSGTIEAEGDPTGAWRLHTGSGGVRLRMASNASFDLNARTSSGSINVSQPVVVQGTIGKKEIHGKIHGGGVPVEVETGSGDIRIE